VFCAEYHYAEYCYAECYGALVMGYFKNKALEILDAGVIV